MYEFWKNRERRQISFNGGRRLGKCLEENTEVLTPTGPVPIKDLKVGDIVYGFNADGSVSETEVIAHDYQGYKDVVDIQNNGRIIGASTLDHVWGMVDTRRPDVFKEIKLKDGLSKNKAIIRREVSIPGGNVDVPEAYALGVLLGDGWCSSRLGNRLCISSKDESIIKAVSEDLSMFYSRGHKDNFNWFLKTSKIPHKHSKKINFKLYDDWCLDKKAHQKIIDIETVKTWNRVSRLKLLAGLIDTDGSVGMYRNRLHVQFSSQSQSIIKGFQYLVHSLTMFKPNIHEETRDKYKNGKMSYCSISHNYFSRKLLKELSPYIQCDRKKYKPEYDELKNNNFNEKFMGFRVSEPRKAHTYDIQVNNETNLYLTSQGLVTHNTYFLCILALEQCLKRPKSTVKFFQPEKGQIKQIVIPMMSEIMKDCPTELLPKYEAAASTYRFPNGSVIQLGGTDKGNHEKLRGGDAHLCLIDEAGFLKAPLGYIVQSILGPTTMRTFGQIVLSSSTPTNPDHDFVRYMERHRINDSLFSVTSKEAVEEHDKVGDMRFTWDMYYNLVEQYPLGENDPEFRRECLNELIIDGTSAIIPEFNNEIEKECVVEWAMPPYCDRYVSMDVGFRDLTVVLFGFYDFQHDCIIVQDEIVMNGPEMTTDVLAGKIFQKEAELWTNKLTNEVMDPYKRVSDNTNLTLLNDFNRNYGLNFVTTDKKDKEAHINNLRTRIANYQVYINPRCKTLINHLKFGTWNKQRSSFARSSDAGHYDAIDALIYLVRNIEFGKNPYPRNYRLGFLGPSDNVFIRPGREEPQTDYEGLKRLFTVKKR